MRSFSEKLLCLAAAVLMVVSFCTVTVSAASPKINKSSLDLPIGYYVDLKVSNAGKDIKWSSGDSDIAEVKALKNNSARITGKKTGTVYIYAKTSGKTLKCKVNVKKSIISSDHNSLDIEAGSSGKITLTVKGSKQISAISSDKSICSVSWGKWKDDTITLTINAKKAGTAKIQIFANGYSKSTSKTISISVTDKNSKTFKQSTTEEMANTVIELVNKERAAVKLDAVSKDNVLSDIAAIRAEEISRNFSHQRPDGTDCFTVYEDNGIINVYMGENIAAFQKSAEEVMDSWMKSPGHKENILSPEYTYIGVGCYEKNGKYYWVQEFSSNY